MLVQRGHGVDHNDCLLGRPRPGRQQTFWLLLRHERERTDRPAGDCRDGRDPRASNRQLERCCFAASEQHYLPPRRSHHDAAPARRAGHEHFGPRAAVACLVHLDSATEVGELFCSHPERRFPRLACPCRETPRAEDDATSASSTECPMRKAQRTNQWEPEGSKKSARRDGSRVARGRGPLRRSCPTSLEEDRWGCAIAMRECESAPIQRSAGAWSRLSGSPHVLATSHQRVDRCLRAGAVGKGPKEVESLAWRQLKPTVLAWETQTGGPARPIDVEAHTVSADSSQLTPQSLAHLGGAAHRPTWWHETLYMLAVTCGH